jgi:TolB-like protein/tetratricopeptide (TPR) repeat protein
MQRFLRAAQARNLDRIAVAYAVAGWILVQGAAILQGAFETPAWTLRFFIVAVVMGFPAALAIAWFTAPAATAPTATAPTATADETSPVMVSHREVVLLALLGAVLLATIGELIFVSRRPAPPAVHVAAQLPSAATIAVLPFVNMSGDPRRDVVSDGISEELLNDLSNVPSLQVVARTSSFAFKGKNEDIRTIASVLGVHSVLEGSIREDGNEVRITAQLIDATAGYNLWAASYDRQMTGILSLEDEIAQAITAALANKLLGRPLPQTAHNSDATHAGKPASIDPEAYRDYLEGLHELGPRTADGVSRAVTLLRAATTRQPDFADAFAALGRALINDAENRPRVKSLMPDAQAALGHALVLDPDNVGALSAELDMALHRLDWKAASADAAKLQAINPNRDAVLHEMFRYDQILGFPELALQAAQATVQLDPLSVVDRLNETTALIHIGRFREAAAAAQAALALQPDQTFVEGMLCTAYAHSGRLADARALAVRFTQAHDSADAQACALDIALGSGHQAEAKRIIDGFAARYPDGDLGTVDLCDDYGVADDAADAVKWCARAYAERDFGLFTIPYDRSIPPSVFADPGWKALADRQLFRAWQAAHDDVAAQLARAK